VVKCNRFVFYKVQYKDWINNLALPRIFQRTEESTLEDRPLRSELPKDLEEDIILEHLRDIVAMREKKSVSRGRLDVMRHRIETLLSVQLNSSSS